MEIKKKLFNLVDQIVDRALECQQSLLQRQDDDSNRAFVDDVNSVLCLHNDLVTILKDAALQNLNLIRQQVQTSINERPIEFSKRPESDSVLAMYDKFCQTHYERMPNQLKKLCLKDNPNLALFCIMSDKKSPHITQKDNRSLYQCQQVLFEPKPGFYCEDCLSVSAFRMRDHKCPLVTKNYRFALRKNLLTVNGGVGFLCHFGCSSPDGRQFRRLVNMVDHYLMQHTEAELRLWFISRELLLKFKQDFDDTDNQGDNQPGQTEDVEMVGGDLNPELAGEL